MSFLRIISRVLLAGVLAGCASVKAQEMTLPEIQAKKTAAMPSIDGELNDPCWRIAEPVSNFWKLDGSGRAESSAKVRMAYDDQNLYIAFECPLKDEAAKNAARETIAATVWSGEVIEVFLSPFSQINNYYHFAMNAANGRIVEKNSMPWNTLWRSAAKIQDDRWVAEIAIPFASLADLDPMEKNWRVSLTHNATCWAPTFLTYHQPEKFGWMKNLDVDFSDYRWRLIPQGAESGDAGTSVVSYLCNRTGKNYRIDMVAKVTPLDGTQRAPESVANKDMLFEQWEAGIELKIPTSDAQQYEVQVSVIDTKTRKVMANAVDIVQKSPPISGVWDRSYYMREETASLEIKAARADLAGAQIECTLENIETKTQIEKQFLTLDRNKSTHVTFNLKNLPEGTYIVHVSTRGNELLKAYPLGDALRKLPYQKGAVQYTNRGVLLMDGKPFFPFGVTYTARHFKDDPKLHKDYADYKFNIVNFEWMSPEQIAEGTQEIQNDPFYSIIGISCAPNVLGVRTATQENPVEVLKASEAFIDQILKSPAREKLFSWYTWDEAPLGPSFEIMRKIGKILHEKDPYHPTFAASNIPGIYTAYYGAVDILGPDPYPGFPGGNVQMVTGWVGTARKAMKNKPVIAFLQSFYDQGQMPNAAEMRAMSYLSVINGANGIFFYSYDHRWGPMAEKFPETWAALKEISKEFDTMAPVLVEEQTPMASAGVPTPPQTEAMLHQHEGWWYLVVVNTRRETLKDVPLMIPAASGDQVEVLFENRNVPLRGTRWRDTFEPLATHVYRVKVRDGKSEK